MKLMSVLVLGLFAAPALAQSTAFTYQGSLKNGGAAASGTHDFRFRLFDAATEGNQVGTHQYIDNLSVAEGVFTATLDFGQQFASTAARFVEIEVRQHTGLTCAIAGGFVVLTPPWPTMPTPPFRSMPPTAGPSLPWSCTTTAISALAPIPSPIMPPFPRPYPKTALLRHTAHPS